MCEAVLFYAQLVHQRLKDSGFYEDVSAFKTSDEVRNCTFLDTLSNFITFLKSCIIV